MGKIAENNTRVMIVIPKDVKAKADIIANADNRSLSGWIRDLIIREINKNNKGDAN